MLTQSFLAQNPINIIKSGFALFDFGKENDLAQKILFLYLAAVGLLNKFGLSLCRELLSG